MKKILLYTFFLLSICGQWQNVIGNPPLLRACIDNNLPLAKYLLAHGEISSVNVGDKEYGCHPLHHACINGNTELVELLLANGASRSINVRDMCGRTPLYHACTRGHTEIAKLLLANGAGKSINVQEGCIGSTPLHAACSQAMYSAKNEALVKLLIEHGAFTNVQDKEGSTPLHIACRRSYKQGAVVKHLIEHGASINTKNKYGNTPLDIARYHGKTDLLELLTKRKEQDEKKLQNLMNLLQNITDF